MANESVQSKGGKARAEKLTSEEKTAIARAGAQARWLVEQNIPKATHSGTLRIGDLSLECAVLDDGRRVLTQQTVLTAIGRSRPAGGAAEKAAIEQVPVFLASDNLMSFISDDLRRSSKPILFSGLSGGRQTVVGGKGGRGYALGYRAELLPAVCEVYLKAREQRVLRPAQDKVAQTCELLVRGLSRVGIIALIDEATGYERDKASHDLAKILEQFIAKELRPWVQTFPEAFYDELFRLRGLSFPKDSVKRPQYFGHLTNDIIYRRLAPGVLEELRRTIPRNAEGRPKAKLFQKLTENVGYRKLLEHLGSVVTLMRLSKDYEGFRQYLDSLHPRYNETLPLHFDGPEPKTGL